MPDGGDETVECSRCSEEVSIEAASMMEKKNSKGLWRYLCPDCLEEIHVPKGYELRRDLSFLTAAASPAEEAAAAEESEPDSLASPRADSSVIADFRGRVLTVDSSTEELTSGRILMDRKQVVLATGGTTTPIPLRSIRDVVPHEETEGEQEPIVTLAYRSGQADRFAFVSAASETLDRFAAVLFKALLGGTSVRFRHPVAVDDATRDPPEGTGTVDVRADAIEVSGPDGHVTIGLDRVATVSGRQRASADAVDRVLAVEHTRRGRTWVTELVHPSERFLGLLRRALRSGRESSPAAREVPTLSEPALAALVELFALGGEGNPAPLGNGQRGSASTVADELVEGGLIEPTGSGYALTRAGRAVVHDRFDQVASTE